MEYGKFLIKSDEENRALLKALEALLELDPEPNSFLGGLINIITPAIQEYERKYTLGRDE